MNICEFLMQPELSFIDSGNMKWNQVRKPFDSSYKFQYELSMTQKFHFVFIFAREIKHISTKNQYKNVQSSKYFQQTESFLAIYIQMNNFKCIYTQCNTSLKLKLAYNSYPQHNGLNKKST